MSLESLEIQLRGDVESLRRRGFGQEAERLQLVLDELSRGLDPIRLVSEHDAMARTGKSRRWLHDRFRAWERIGAAEMRDRIRHYRLCVLPIRLLEEQGARDAEAVLAA